MAIGTVNEKVSVKPFMKYAGNKFRIIDRIRPLLPPGQQLVEPFLGSGAVFLNTDYSSYLLADANPVLITLYKILRDEGENFIEYCRSFFVPDNNNAERYYELRKLYNTTTNPRLKSALILFMTRFGFNGLMRHNKRGQYNVPFGRYKSPYFPEEEMRNFIKRSRLAEFVCVDFREMEQYAKPNQVWYCDPPYQGVSSTSNFADYYAGGFGEKEQIDLAEMAKRITKKGITVVLSNHDTPLTRDIYSGAEILSFGVQRFISCDGANRRKAQEILAVFRP